jgi:hypothetical protein
MRGAGCSAAEQPLPLLERLFKTATSFGDAVLARFQAGPAAFLHTGDVAAIAAAAADDDETLAVVQLQQGLLREGDLLDLLLHGGFSLDKGRVAIDPTNSSREIVTAKTSGRLAGVS